MKHNGKEYEEIDLSLPDFSSLAARLLYRAEEDNDCGIDYLCEYLEIEFISFRQLTKDIQYGEIRQEIDKCAFDVKIDEETGKVISNKWKFDTYFFLYDCDSHMDYYCLSFSKNGKRLSAQQLAKVWDCSVYSAKKQCKEILERARRFINGDWCWVWVEVLGVVLDNDNIIVKTESDSCGGFESEYRKNGKKIIPYMDFVNEQKESTIEALSIALRRKIESTAIQPAI